MNLQSILKAEIEAREFLSKAKQVREEAQNSEIYFMTGSRLTGSLRRQSMELTNALTDLRKSG